MQTVREGDRVACEYGVNAQGRVEDLLLERSVGFIGSRELLELVKGIEGRLMNDIPSWLSIWAKPVRMRSSLWSAKVTAHRWITNLLESPPVLLLAIPQVQQILVRLLVARVHKTSTTRTIPKSVATLLCPPPEAWHPHQTYMLPMAD